jgi:seryl-tRNA synthetase
MLDLAHLRKNFDAVRARLEARGAVDGLDRFTEVDARRRAAVTEIEGLKARRNSISAEVAQAKREGRDAADLVGQSRAVGEQVNSLEDNVNELDAALRDILSAIPNIPHDSVPTGPDASANVEVRRVGEPRQFDFAPQSHWDLGPALGILDFERAAKITGARFAVYWNAGARLERALIIFMLDLQNKNKGFNEVLPPFIVTSTTLHGTGQLPKFAPDQY